MDVNPLRGEVWLVDLGSVEPQLRPGIVVNTDVSINQPTRLVIPLRKNVTSSGADWHVLIEASEENGLDTLSIADASLIRSVGLERFHQRLGVLQTRVITRIADSIPIRFRGGFRPQNGKQIGDWKLTGRLGTGGSAEVWAALKEDSSTAAIKILKTGDHYRYRRFKAEVELLLTLGHHEGVLPLIEAHLPESTNDKSPAWLAMPIAIGIRDALGNNPSLELVVESIASVAETLSDLATKNISHRDIKPSNLYQHEGKWKIGDFGLADYPSKEALTLQGRRMGPLYFMPDEMIENADTADGNAADVYSLAKTLWVLASGQTYPPQGQLRVEVPQLRLSNNIGHPRARILDLLIERATHPDPKQRPQIIEVANELRAWLRPVPADTSYPDISDLGIQFKAAVAPVQRADSSKHRMIQEAQQIPNVIERKLRPLSQEIAKYNALTHIAFEPNIFLAVPANRAFGSPDVWWEDTRCVVSKISNAVGARLSSGFGLRLTEDGKLTIIAAHLIISHRVQNEWSDSREALLGSALSERAIDELYEGLRYNYRSALQSFLQSLP